MRSNRILLFSASRRIYSENKEKKKKTVQLKLENIMFFCQNSKGHLRQLPINELNEEILSAYGATLKLDNQKNGWKGVCVYQEHNGDEKFSPVRALGRQCISIKKMSNKKRYL